MSSEGSLNIFYLYNYGFIFVALHLLLLGWVVTFRDVFIITHVGTVEFEAPFLASRNFFA
jgi:hypothetical protein